MIIVMKMHRTIRPPTPPATAMITVQFVPLFPPDTHQTRNNKVCVCVTTVTEQFFCKPEKKNKQIITHKIDSSI